MNPKNMITDKQQVPENSNIIFQHFVRRIIEARLRRDQHRVSQ
jgi:hypothetical protein